jgi:hypothetical protein
MNWRLQDIALFTTAALLFVCLVVVIVHRWTSFRPESATAALIRSCVQKAPEKLAYCTCFYTKMQSSQKTEMSSALILSFIQSSEGSRLARECLSR